MSLISGALIRKLVASGSLGIAPFDEANLKDASYTFTLAAKALRFDAGQVLEVGKEAARSEIFIPETGYALQPGEFLLGYTRESLSLNGSYACHLSVRGSCAQIGLNALLSDSFAEPDTDGVLALAISNAGPAPIMLYPGMKIVKGIFVVAE